MYKQATRLALSALLLGLTILGPQARATTLGISSDGRFFTLDGVPTYLNGVSYYGAQSIGTASFRTDDLDDFAGDGFNWIRVWAVWTYNGYDVSVVNGDGTVRQPFMDELKLLIVEADARGIVVDVTMTRADAYPPPTNQAEHLACVQTLASELQSYPNVYIDVANERDVGDARFVSLAEVGALCDAIKAIDPDRLCTASGAPGDANGMEEYFAVGHVDFLTPHLCRGPDCPAQTIGTVQDFVGWMAEKGFRAPVHLQEPFRMGYSLSYQPTVEDFFRDDTGAKVAEAAGWCLHNGSNQYSGDLRPFRCFDMRDGEGRLYAQFESTETEVLAGLDEQIGGTDVNVRRYQAEYSEQLAHITGQRDGFTWAGVVGRDAPGYLSFGPYIDTVPAGEHRVDWRLQVDDLAGGTDAVVTLDVYSTDTVLAERTVLREELVAANEWQDFSLPFSSTGQGALEFRTAWPAIANVKLDWVTLVIHGGSQPVADAGVPDGAVTHDAGSHDGQAPDGRVPDGGTSDNGGGEGCGCSSSQNQPFGFSFAVFLLVIIVMASRKGRSAPTRSSSTHNGMARGSRMCRLGAIFAGAIVVLLSSTRTVAQPTYPLGVYGDTADLAAGTDGALHLVWTSGNTIRHGLIVAGVVTDELVVGTDVSTLFCRPRIALHPDGTSVHVVWTTADHGILRHAWRDGVGAFQSEDVWQYSTEASFYWETAAVDHDGTVHVIAGQVPRAGACMGVTRLYYTSKPISGSFTTPTPLVPDDCLDYVDVFMANDALGGIHARFSRYDDHLRYLYAPSGGSLATAVSEPVYGAAGVTSMGMGDIFAMDDGTVHLAINAYAGAVHVDHSVKAPLGAFSVPERVSTGSITGSTEVTPSIGVDRLGAVYVLWGGEALGADIRLGVLDEGQWTVSTISSTAGMNDQNKPKVVVAGDVVYGLWRQADGEWVLWDLSASQCSGQCGDRVCGEVALCHCGDCSQSETCDANGQCQTASADAGVDAMIVDADALSPADANTDADGGSEQPGSSGDCNCADAGAAGGSGTWILSLMLVGCWWSIRRRRR